MKYFNLSHIQAAPLPSSLPSSSSSSSPPPLDPLETPDDALSLLSLSPGTQCLHRGCSHRYEGAREREGRGGESVCVYHPGVPLFHEGLKGWTCCKKRYVWVCVWVCVLWIFFSISNLSFIPIFSYSHTLKHTHAHTHTESLTLMSSCKSRVVRLQITNTYPLPLPLPLHPMYPA